MSGRTRFVNVSEGELRAELGYIGSRVEEAGGEYRFTTGGREVVFELFPKAAEGDFRPCVKVYTSIGSNGVRAKGVDAIRIVVGVYAGDRFRPLDRSSKLLRTAPKGKTEAARVRSFLERFRTKIRGAYEVAREVRSCPRCREKGLHKIYGTRIPTLVLRSGVKGEFLGCRRFPACRYSENL